MRSIRAPVDPVAAGAQPHCDAPAGEPCSVCADEAVSMTVVSVDPARDVAVAEALGRRETVAVDLLDQVRVGDVLMVHLGFAIATVESDP